MKDSTEPSTPLLPADSPATPSAPAATRAPLPRWMVPVFTAVMLAVTAAVLVVLWRWIDDLALADAEKAAAAHLDAVKVSASIAVGGGGLFALYLAARRQRTQELELEARHAELAQRDQVQAHTERVAETNRVHAERVAAASERDANDRRITELYAKSVEQLGADKAPVRLGGLYALERLAQENPDQRVTVVNVLCAYLRMLYTEPAGLTGTVDEQSRAQYADRVQERQVRLTAQRILATHLSPGNDPDQPVDTFWPDTDLDLTGATLVDFDMIGRQARTARFGGATFTGITRFDKAMFTGDAQFTGAWFGGDTRFTGATFTENTQFDMATFKGETEFDGVVFAGYALFDWATFADQVWFNGATFGKQACFKRVTFDRQTRFNDAKFSSEAWFNEATFTDEAWFDRTTFTDQARFDNATFAGLTRFIKATFTEGISFDGARATDRHGDTTQWPAGWQLTEKHSAIEGMEGTWHFLVNAPIGSIFEPAPPTESRRTDQQ